MSLIVRPIGANLTRDTELFGRMDPYCVVTCGDQRQITEVCQDGGKHPAWGTALNFQPQTPVLNVEIWDKESITADDLVGQGTVNIGHIRPGQSAAVMCEIRYEGRRAGFVNINVECQMMGGMGTMCMGNMTGYEVAAMGGNYYGGW